MAAENKFLFETDFSDLEALESRAEKYSEADIAAARQAAMEEVRNELREFEEKRAADLMAQMAARLEQLSAGRQQDLQAATESAIDIAVAMCRKILPALAAKNALSEIEGHVARTLAEVHGEPRVVVRVADENLQHLQSAIDRVTSGYDGKIVLLADDRLAATDCHVMWADGGCDRDVQRTWAAINKAVEQITDHGIGGEPAQTAPETDQGGASDTIEISHSNNELQPSSEAID